MGNIDKLKERMKGVSKDENVGETISDKLKEINEWEKM